MSTEGTYFSGAIVVGLGATLFMDLWALFIRRAFSLPPSNYCWVGRWLLHMPGETFTHASIAAASQKRYECTVGWIAHYVLGVVYALILMAFVSESWLERPTLLPAIIFSLVSLLEPFLITMPAVGLGIAATRVPNPTRVRLGTLMAHTIFGVGLYVCAVGVSYVLRVHA